MSTTFGIFDRIPPITTYGEVDWDMINKGNIPYEYTEVAFRSTNISWRYAFVPIEPWLESNVRVFPLDNTPQGIYTIGDIRSIIEQQNLKYNG